MLSHILQNTDRLSSEPHSALSCAPFRELPFKCCFAKSDMNKARQRLRLQTSESVRKVRMPRIYAETEANYLVAKMNYQALGTG